MGAKQETDLIQGALHFVAERSWRQNDSDFHADLVTFLGEALGVAFAFCDVIKPDDPTHVDTLALWAHGEVTQNITYSLEKTPCENVIGRTTCCYVDNVQKLFPEDELLVEMAAESYAGTPIWSSDGKPLGLVAVVDDKPLSSPDLVKSVLQIVAVRAGGELERSHFLQDIERNQQRLLDFSAASSDWLWETDDQLRWIFFSDNFEATSGVKPSMLLGKTRAEVGAPGASPAQLQELLRTMEERRPIQNFVHHRDHPERGRVYLSINALPAFEDGRFIGYRGTGRDITQQVETEARLQRVYEAEQKASKAKSEFLASMSHELRTPLNAILGFSDMLKTEYFGPLGLGKYKNYSEYIHDSGEHMLALVNDLLDISAIEAGKRSYHMESVDLGEVVREGLTHIEQAVKDAKVQLIPELPRDLPLLLADRRSLFQIVLNLLSNAVKFTEAGGTIRVSVEASEKKLSLRVEDTGIGIPAEKLGTITEPFTQSNDRPDTAKSGTGLGLSIVDALVDFHKGTLTINSEVGTGTTVAVDLPVQNS